VNLKQFLCGRPDATMKTIASTLLCFALLALSAEYLQIGSIKISQPVTVAVRSEAWVRIPLKACVVLSFVGRGLATG
jgi:hypothetical protein